MALSVVIEAKNVEEAIEKASTQYHVEKAQLKYDIISYGSSGIFGLGKSRNAKIRVHLPEPPAPKKAENDDPPRGETENDEVQALIEETFEAPAINGQGEASIESGRRVLQKIIDAITHDAKVVVSSNHHGVVFQVDGGNAAIIIGKHGQTLEAIQNIVEKVVNKQIETRTRVQIDVAGYLKNRESLLQRQADKFADKCQRIGKPVSLGYLNAHDRRIVHLALKDNPAVRTQSVGDGPQRKLMIYPKKTNSWRRRRSANSR